MNINDRHVGAHEEIFNSSAESIIVSNCKGEIVMANPQSERLFGFDRGELIQEKIEILIPESYKKDHKYHRENFNKKPETRKMGVGRDLTGLKKDGSVFPIEVSLNPAKIGDESVVIAFVIDITERKKIETALEKSEQQLVKYAAELERRVSTRTEELAAMVKKLEESNERGEREIAERKKAEEEAKVSLEKERELNELKSRFVSMASHEFRTPLSTILSSAALISKYDDSSNQEKILKHINRIKSNVSDLTGILNDFLSLDKLEEGGIQNYPQQIDLVKFIYDVIDELQIVTKANQVITFESTVVSYDILVDPNILKHIIANLVSNAIKYSNEGDTIKILLTNIDNQIQLKVQDEGIGIPEMDQKHLFERFFRAHNAINIQGTGLGLNLVKKYLDLIGGSIDYSSTEQEGSEFIVTLYNTI